MNIEFYKSLNFNPILRGILKCLYISNIDYLIVVTLQYFVLTTFESFELSECLCERSSFSINKIYAKVKIDVNFYKNIFNTLN